MRSRLEKIWNDRLLAWGSAFSALMIAAPLAFGAVNAYARTQAALATVHAATDDHEQRLRKLEETVTRTAEDVAWLRHREEAKAISLSSPLKAQGS
jgi:hypothetical protein